MLLLADLVADGPLAVRAAGERIALAPAVVVTLAEGEAAPAGATHLGGPFWRVPSSAPLADALRFEALGVRAFPDLMLERRPAFDDPDYGGQWYLDTLGMDALYAESLGDASVRVAVLDSGIDVAHADLAAAIDAPYDAFSDDDDPSPNPGEYCGGGSAICDEHGTAVAGVVAARADNGAFIVGMCPECTLVPIKLLGEGTGAMSADIAAFEHAIAQDVAVINNSWGYTQRVAVPEPLAEVIARATTEPRDGLGALVVFAAGNDDRRIHDNELVALPGVLCVAATDSYGNPTNYTNFGDPVSVSAPSATVTIAPGDTLITNFGGTSGAAPVVSGLAAWAAAQDPDLSSADLLDLLVSTAEQSPLAAPDDDGHDDYYGWGEISAENILRAFYPEEVPIAEGCACGHVPIAFPWIVILFGLRRCSRS